MHTEPDSETDHVASQAKATDRAMDTDVAAETGTVTKPETDELKRKGGQNDDTNYFKKRI